jgi:membrane protease YdiL (CAAX protease family)
MLYGPNGLRAGWSIAIYIAVVVALLFLVGLEMRWLIPHLPVDLRGARGGAFHPTVAILSEASVLIAVLLATAGMARLEYRHTAFYGLAGFDRARQFFIGLACGFAFLSLLIGILVATHHLTLTQSHMTLGWTLRYAAAWGLAFLLVGMTEEFMLRGYLLFTLARGIRFWPAALVLAILFGALHKGNPGESPFGLVAAASIALVFSLSLWRLGHLWWAIGFHASWDWAESFFYGTPDSGAVSAGRLMEAHPHGALLLSGGATGPEGSAWVALVILLAAILVWKTQPNRGLQLGQK